MVRSEKLRGMAAQALARAQEIESRMAEAEGEPSEADQKAAEAAMADHDRYQDEADKAEAFEKRMREAEERASTPPGRKGSRPSEPAGDAPHTDEKNTKKGKHRYSFLKALRQSIEPGGVDGLEKEVSDHLAKIRGKPPTGVYVPTDLPIRVGAMDGVQYRDVDTTAGAGAIQAVLSGSFIDILRNRLAVQQMGATVLTNMTGTFAIPKQTASGTAYWVAEGGAPTESGQTIGQVTFTPKTVGAYTDYTRRFMLQSSIDAEAFVRNDLMAVVARAVDLAAINGSGTSNQPLGILNYGGTVATVALGTNGGPLTWAALVAMETEVAADNADEGSMGYLVNAVTRGHLKVTPKIGTTFPEYLWTDGNTVNGYPVRVSNQVPRTLTKGTSNGVCSAAIFGNWSDLVLAFWSGMDVLVDPYTASTSGTVRVVVLQDVDLNLRRGESFSVIKDITTA